MTRLPDICRMVSLKVTLVMMGGKWDERYDII